MAEESSRFSDEEESTIRDFLLGGLAESEREQVEERLLVDPAFSELVSAIETELIDDYTAGLLDRDGRRLFEGAFLVTEDRRRRLQFSQVLARATVGMTAGSAVRPERMLLGVRQTSLIGRTWLQAVAATVAVAALGSTLWMFQSLGGLRARLHDTEGEVIALRLERERLVEQYRLEREQAAARMATIPTERLPSRAAQTHRDRLVVAAMLTPGTLRAPNSALTAVAVDSSTLLIELQLDISDNAFPSYAASVHDVAGNELFRLNELRSEKASKSVLVTVQVPASRLPAGDYSIRLLARTDGELEEIERYYVRILRPKDGTEPRSR